MIFDSTRTPLQIIRLVCCVLLLTLLVGCTGYRHTASVDDRSVKSSSSKRLSRASSRTWATVRKGDTLFSISFAHGYDFKTIARLNGIKSPYTIYVGQRLRLKGKVVTKRKTTPKTKSQSTKRKKSKSKKVAAVARKPSKIRWQWPTKGRILRKYSAKAPRKKGIGITGGENQTVIAAAAGRVVYSGNGLIGYGNLIIVKHEETYLSAYAHNNKVMVKEGQKVKRGQKIALMGVNENNTPMLHFEIRKNGKPVNPLAYLPRR